MPKKTPTHMIVSDMYGIASRMDSSGGWLEDDVSALSVLIDEWNDEPTAGNLVGVLSLLYRDLGNIAGILHMDSNNLMRILEQIPGNEKE